MKLAKNQLFYGDNLKVLRKYIKDETIDLCYIDPPFNSKRNYNQIYNNIGKEDKAQAQAFVDTWTWDDEAINGFDEITGNYNGVFTKQSIQLIVGLKAVLGEGSLIAYLVSMTLRIAEIHRVLKPTGTFYFHCDPTASHYLKLIIDAVFCANKGEFRNEIIWCYSGGGRSNNNFANKHDVIFRYTKTEEYTFNDKDIRVPYNLDTSKRTSAKAWGSHNDKTYMPNPDGKIPEDWWVLSPINSQSQERLGYPTQKPEALLERIIQASTNKGDTILDAYCGCGTTVAVAERLGRKWIGIDITYQSISLILKRLTDTFDEKTSADVTLFGVPKDFESAVALAHKKDDRVRKEFEKWAVLTYSNNKAIINDKKGGDGGIDGACFMVDRDDKGATIYPQILFSVKSDKKYPPSYIRDLNGVLERENAAMGIMIVLYDAENLIKESKKYGVYKNKLIDKAYPKIQVVSVNDIMNGKLMDVPITANRLKEAEEKAKDEKQPKLF